jgi:hypothetical protein
MEAKRKMFMQLRSFDGVGTTVEYTCKSMHSILCMEESLMTVKEEEWRGLIYCRTNWALQRNLRSLSKVCNVCNSVSACVCMCVCARVHTCLCV